MSMQISPLRPCFSRLSESEEIIRTYLSPCCVILCDRLVTGAKLPQVRGLFSSADTIIKILSNLIPWFPSSTELTSIPGIPRQGYKKSWTIGI